MGLTKDYVAEVLSGIIASSEAELRQIQQAELECHWHFRYDDSASLEWNIYQFHKLLGLYGNFCRRWEEIHNGHRIVVERVRDTYLMPKIREFAERLGRNTR